MPTPIADRDQNGRERERLPNLDTNIEAHDVCQESVPGDGELLQLRRQTEAMKQSEAHYGQTCVRSKTGQPVEAAYVLERFICDRQADDRIDDVGVRVDASEDAGEQRDAVI